MKKPMLTPGESIINCLCKLKDFSGRARRSEYWWFIAAVSIIMIIIYFIIIHVDSDVPNNKSLESILSFVYFFPCLSVAIRRLHDSGRSGWYFLCTFIPYIGIFIMIALLLADSEETENKYGPSPKYVDDDSQQYPADNANFNYSGFNYEQSDDQLTEFLAKPQ